MNIKNRILTFCERSGISVREFQTQCGFSNAYVSNLKGDSMKLDKIDKILSVYPQINRNWLIYESGSMLVGENKDEIECLAVEDDNQNKVNNEKSNLESNKMLDIIANQQSTIEKQQSTIERLTKIIENVVGK